MKYNPALPKLPISTLLKKGWSAIEVIRTWQYLRMVSAMRCGHLPADVKKICADLGITPKTFQSRLRVLRSWGAVIKTAKGNYRLVTIRSANLKEFHANRLVAFTFPEVCDKKTFSAKCFTVCVALETLTQDFLERRRENEAQKAKPKKHKEAHVRSHAKRQVICSARMSFSFASTLLKMSKSTLSKVRRKALELGMLDYEYNFEYVTADQRELISAEPKLKPIFFDKKMNSWRINDTTRYKCSYSPYYILNSSINSIVAAS